MTTERTMRWISRFLFSGALAFSISPLGCESSKTDSPTQTDSSADATEAADGTDGVTAADGVESDESDGDGDDGPTDSLDDGYDGPSDTDDGQTDGPDGMDDGPDGGEDGEEGFDFEACVASDCCNCLPFERDACVEAGTPCDGERDTADGGVCSDPPTFAAPRTHMVSLTIPAGMADFKCDSDNSGAIDAKDGELNALLAGTLKSFFDVNALLAANVAEGDIVLIADLAGTMTDGEGEDLTINMYLGEKIDPATADCFDVEVTATDKDGAATATAWDGESKCAFSIDPKSFNAGHCPVVQIAGASVADGQIDAGPVTFNFSLPLGVITLDVEIETGRFNGTVTDAFRVTDGRLCGQIPFAKLKQAFEDVCYKDPSQQLCSFKGIALPIIQGECKKSGDTNCTISIALESAVAGEFTPADPE